MIRESGLPAGMQRGECCLLSFRKGKKNLQRGSSGGNIGAVPLVPPKAKMAHYTPILTALVSKAADTLCIMILSTSVVGKPNQ